MNSELLTIPIVLGVLAGLVYAFPKLLQIYHVYTAPTCSIGNAASENLVKLAGRAAGEETPSPITGVRGVFWQAEVKEQQRSGKRSHWVTIFEQTSSNIFFLTDDTGTVKVHPTGAELIFSSDFEEDSGFFEGNSRFATQMEMLGINTKNFLGFDKRLSVKERIIHCGDPLIIVGKVEYDGLQAKVSKHKGQSYIISDKDNKDLLGQLYRRAGGKFLMGAGVVGGISLLFLQNFMKR